MTSPEKSMVKMRELGTLIRECVGDMVAKTSVEGVGGGASKELLDVTQTGHLEDLGFAHNDLAICLVSIKCRVKKSLHMPVQGGHQLVGTHDDRSLRELIVVLLDTLEVFSSRVRLADSSRSQVQDPVPVPTDIGVELGHAEMYPARPIIVKTYVKRI